MAYDDGEGIRRVSVSRDALRADLAEMELRLRVFIEAELRGKANQYDLVELGKRVKDLEDLRRARDRGELTPALERQIRSLASAEDDLEQAKDWTGRQRVMAVVSLLIAATMLFLSILLAIYGGGGL